MKKINILAATFVFIGLSTANAQLLKNLKDQVKESVGTIKDVAKGGAENAYKKSLNFMDSPSSNGLVVKTNDEIIQGVIQLYPTSSYYGNLMLRVEQPNGESANIRRSDIRAFIYDGREFFMPTLIDEKLTNEKAYVERISNGDSKLYFVYEYDFSTNTFNFTKSIFVNKKSEKTSFTVQNLISSPEMKQWMKTNFSDFTPLVEYVNTTKETMSLKRIFDSYNKKDISIIHTKEPESATVTEITQINEGIEPIGRDIAAEVILETPKNTPNRTNIVQDGLNIGYVIASPKEASMLGTPNPSDLNIFMYSPKLEKDILIAKFNGTMNSVKVLKNPKAYNLGNRATQQAVVEYLVKNKFL